MLAVVLDPLPAVAAPAHDRGKRQRDRQPRAGPHRADRGVRPPEGVRRDRPPGAIALPHRARPVERPLDLPRHQQLDELGMRPGQRHRRAACPPRKQPALGIGSASQTCSGIIPPGLAIAAIAAR